MANKVIGLTLRVATADTAKRLAEVEQKLRGVTDEIKQARKEGKDNVYAQLRQEQLLLQQSAGNLRKEFRETTKAFQDQKFPADSIIGLKNRYADLIREVQKLSKNDPEFGKKAAEAKKLSAAIKQAEEQVKDYNFGLVKALKQTQDVFANGISVFGGVAGANLLDIGVNAFSDVIADIRETAKEVITLRGEIVKLTGATEQGSDLFARQIQSLGDTFGADYQEILLAANSLTDQLTGNFEESLALIEKGFIAGADSNGEFLDTLKEYPAFFREANLTGDQFIATITQSVQEGVFSDKGADLIKEFSLRIRELTPATEKALKQLGISSQEIAKQIDEEGLGGAFTLVQEKLRLLRDDSPAVGAALADIFGGPGEDAGIGFIKTLDLTATSLEDLVDITNPYIQQQIRLKEANDRVAAAQAELVNEFAATQQNLQVLGRRALAIVLEGLLKFLEVIKQIPAFLNENKVAIGALAVAFIAYNQAAIIAQLATLKKAAADKIAAASSIAFKRASDLLNISLRANPIGLIVTAVGLLIAGFTTLYNRSLTVRAGIDGLGAVAKELFDIVGEAVTNFVEGFRRIGEGDFKGAFDSFSNALVKGNPIGIALTQGDRLAKAFEDGYNERIANETSSNMEAATEEGITRFQNNVNGKFESSGKEAGEKFGGGLNRELGKTFAEAEKVAATSIAGIQAQIQKLNAELEKAPDAQAYDRIALEIERLEGVLETTTQRFENFRNIQRGIVAEIPKLTQALDEFLKRGNLDATLQQQGQGLLQQAQSGPLSQADAAQITSSGQYETLAQRAKLEQEQQVAEALLAIRRNTEEQTQNLQKESLEKQREQLLEYTERQEEILTQGANAIGQALGSFFGDTEASFEDLNKALLDIALDALQKTVLLAIAEGSIKELASKGLLGIATGAIVTGLIQGIFAGVRAQIQRFNRGGVVELYPGLQAPVLSPGLIRTRQNIPTQPGGDNVLAMVRNREMILTTYHQRLAERLYGRDIWKRLGVPGFSSGGQVLIDAKQWGKIKSYATGGLVAASPPQVLNPSVTIPGINANAQAEFTPDNIGLLSETMASRVAQALGDAVEQAIGAANERQERQRQLRRDITL